MPPKSQQQEAEPTSFAPTRREVTCVHEAGHAVVGVYLFGSIAGARVNLDGGGGVWRDAKPSDDKSEDRQEAARKTFPAVEAIARALDREDELDGEAVARLISLNLPLLSCSVAAIERSSG
jgi:hypothetical protein